MNNMDGFIFFRSCPGLPDILRPSPYFSDHRKLFLPRDSGHQGSADHESTVEMLL